MSEKRVLLLASAWFPPAVTGSSILNRNLWKEWPKEEVLVLTGEGFPAKQDLALVVPGVRTVAIRLTTPGGGRVHARLKSELEVFGFRHVWRAIRSLHSEVKFDAVFASWPTSAFLLGAMFAAKDIGIPLFVHMHDLWEEGASIWKHPLEKATAFLLEGRILRNAAIVFCITPEAAEFFGRKHGVSPVILPHAIPDEDLDRPLSKPEVRIGVVHFAGTIYGLMNLDAVRNAVDAVRLSARGATLECCTPNDATTLAREGIGGERVTVTFKSRSDLIKAQASASILLMPLAFRSSNPAEIDTVFPTKLLEYWISGRPIIVHAPPTSWAARAARKEGWAEVVDEPDPVKLANAIDRLLADEARCASLVEAARRMAETRRASIVTSALRKAIGWA